MKHLPLILDLETKHTFKDHTDPKKLGVSVVGVFDYTTKKSSIFREENIDKLFPLLENAGLIVGYNIKKFDLPVLSAYYPGDIENLPAFDILEEIKGKIGRRVSLDDVVSATLGKRKTGHGLLAIEYYRQGNWSALEKYCLDDVMLTKEIFEHGVYYGKIFYFTEKGKEEIEVDWKNLLQDKTSDTTTLTLPF